MGVRPNFWPPTFCWLPAQKSSNSERFRPAPTTYELIISWFSSVFEMFSLRLFSDRSFAFLHIGQGNWRGADGKAECLRAASSQQCSREQRGRWWMRNWYERFGPVHPLKAVPRKQKSPPMKSRTEKADFRTSQLQTGLSAETYRLLCNRYQHDVWSQLVHWLSTETPSSARSGLIESDAPNLKFILHRSISFLR